MQWLKDAWNYSRIIFINVVAAVAASANEIVGYLLGVDYDAFFRHSVSVTIGLIVNFASILLRVSTIAPPGVSAIDKEALREALREVREEADEQSKVI